MRAYCGVYAAHRARCALGVPSAAWPVVTRPVICPPHELVLWCMLRGDVARAGRTVLLGRAGHAACVCSMLPKVVIADFACCLLHVADCILFAASCARHGRRRHGREPHARRMRTASCTVRVAWCVGCTAHLCRSALPQGMLRDARRPGLWHACGAYSCIPNGAAHGEGKRAVAFGVRRAGVRRTFVFRHLVVVCFSFGAAMPCSSL